MYSASASRFALSSVSSMAFRASFSSCFAFATSTATFAFCRFNDWIFWVVAVISFSKSVRFFFMPVMPAEKLSLTDTAILASVAIKFTLLS